MMKNKILTVATGLFGLMMLNSGLNKFLHYMPMPEMSEAAGKTMMAFVEAGWIFPLIAIVEIVGGVLIAIPKFRALGAIIILPVMVGILLFHLVQEPSTIAMSLIFFGINIWAIVDNRAKYAHLIG